MTESDMRQDKMLLRIEIEETEVRLGHLRERAKRRGDSIVQFGQWLRDSPETHIYRDGYSAHHSQPVAILRVLQNADIEALDLKPTLELADAIRQEIGKLEDLKRRLSSL